MNDSFKLAPGEWSTLRRLLDQALDRPAAERAAWLAALGPEDAPFRPRLQALLAHAGDATAKQTVARLLDTLPQVETAQFAPPQDQSALSPGAAVGLYRLLRPLGEGGMGEVWLAERTDLLQSRQVALKLPRLVTGRVRLAERLAREREILATLEHPNIARLYDAGVSADGQPYLALEYVEGERIDVWCTRRALDVPARLRLFLQVARAVAHAHARLVVHRDLKPANILVTEAGEVRLLDFGIAKLLEDGSAQETELTQLAGRVLTPDYAAPEQILGQSIGTAADVYALGVVLFELLTGTRPYRLKRDSRAALEEAIARAEVQRPSSVVADARLRRRLRGDLDTIVLKALKRTTAERYGTVEALADDIERHLDQRPVRAQPDSPWYRALKFLHRNRVATGAAASIAAALVAATAISLWQVRVAVAERERAEEVKTFIAELLRDANPALQGGRKVTVDELLLSTGPKIDARFPDRPQIRAELLTIVGTSLAAMGEPKAALPLLERAADVSMRELGPEHVQSLHSRSLLIGQRQHVEPGAQVARDADEVIAAMRRTPAVDPAYFANLLGQRAQMARDEGQHAAAIAFAEEAYKVASQRVGETKEMTLNLAVALALAHQRSGDWRRALEAARNVQRLVFDVRKLPDDHFNAVDARLMLGMALADAGELAAGLAELEAGVKNALVRRKPTDSAVASFRTHLARYQLRAGLVDEALTNYREAQQVHRAVAGVKSRRFAATSSELALAELAALRPERAVTPLREAAAYFGSDSPDVLAKLVPARLAAALAATGHLDEAQALVTLDPGENWELLFRQGQVWRRADRVDAAAGALGRALEVVGDAPAARVNRAEVLAELGWARLGSAPDEAAALFEQAVTLLRRHQLRPSPLLALTLGGQAEALVAEGKPGEALDKADEAATIWRVIGPDHPAASRAGRAAARSPDQPRPMPQAASK